MAEKQSLQRKAAEVVPQRRLPPLLRRAWYGLNQAFRRRIKNQTATPDQYTVMRLLSEAGDAGLSQRVLCQMMASDPNTIAALVSRMEQTGLVERTVNPVDKRAHRVTINAKGRRVFHNLRAIALKLQRDILATLPAERREQFLADLEAVADACSKTAERS